MLLFVPLTFLAGALAAQRFPLPWWAALATAALGTAALGAARRPWQVAAGLSLLAGALALPHVALAARTQPPSPLARSLDAQPAVALRGAVETEPVPRPTTQLLRLRVDAARFADGEWVTTYGHAQVTARPAPSVEEGDVLEVRGQARGVSPDDASPAAAALRRQGIDALALADDLLVLGHEPSSPPRAVLRAVRQRLADALQRALPEPQAALVQGILVGQRATLPRDLTQAFNRAGTAHILAVSGYNVSLAIGLVAHAVGGARSRRAGRRWLAAGLATGALWTFVALVGASGSVLRAAAMAQLALVGRGLGRSATAGGLLLWGSAFLVAAQPAVLLDAGWQLSFLGTAGLIWLAPWLATRLHRLPAAVREALAATVAAQVFVLPVLASTFGQVSLVAPLANVLALPLVPPIMLGGAALVAAAALPPGAPVAGLAAPLCAALTWVPATALIRVVQWAAALPGAALPLPAWGGAPVAAYLLALVALCCVLQRQPPAAASAPPSHAHAPPPARGTQRWLPGASLGALAATACVAWAMAPPLPAAAVPALLVTVPAIASGSLVLVRAPDGTRLLIGGGPTTSTATALLGEQLRPWDRTVDAVLLADPRDASLLGLPPALDRYRIGVLLDAAGDYPSPAYRQARAAAERRAVPLRDLASPGSTPATTVLSIGGTLTLELLPLPAVNAPPPSAPSASSLSPGSAGTPPAPAVPAVRLSWGSFSLLLPGDVSAARQRALLAAAASRPSTALLLAERAARSSAADALVRAAAPELVLVQGEPPPGQPPPAPQPSWHYTAAGGPLRLEVTPSGYRLLPS